MAKLKPCPFCGGIPTDPFYYDPYDGYQGNLGRYIVKCTNCRVEIERATKEQVTDAWNRRSENEELKFTRQFIHEHGLEFELASAWKGRTEDGK